MDLPRTLLSSVSILALTAVAEGSGNGAALALDLEGSNGQLPAVSGLNVKVGGFGAHLNDETPAGVFAALALPLSRDFGLQVDGVSGKGNGAPFYGVGGHLFWRDPSRGLLGAYASHLVWEASSDEGTTDFQRTEASKVGLESQLYLGRLSLEGMAAYQFGTLEGFAGKGTVAYYPRDDFRVHLTAGQVQGPGFFASAGFEWAPPTVRALSLFADIGFDEDRDVRSLFGLKLYFSREDKSLIRRHREDDPDVDLPNDLFQSIQTRQIAGPVCPVGQTLINGFCDGNN